MCDSYCTRLLSALLSAASRAALTNRAHCEAPEPHCFLGKMPEASVEEMRWVGACRLKYLQWRHAMASFIRCLTSWTIKLSAVLNQSQILFFIWRSYIYFPPSLKGLCLYLKLHTLTHWFTRLELKSSHSFNTMWKHIKPTRPIVFRENMRAWKFQVVQFCLFFSLIQ